MMKWRFLHNKSNILLVVLLAHIVSINGWGYPLPNMNAAMAGYDPVWADPSVSPDPGVRSKIFYPIKRQNHMERVKLYSFISTAAENTDCKDSIVFFENFNQYFSEKVKSVLFTGDFDSGQLGLGSGQLLNASIDGQNENMRVLHFFQNVTGEIIQRIYECSTHVVNLSLSNPPVFDRQFEVALTKLNSAAKNPNSTESEAEFVRFVRSYGTHFMQSTRLGSRVSFEKRFPDKTFREIKAECVITSADFSLDHSTSTNTLASVESIFSQEIDKCSPSSDSFFNFDQDFPAEKVKSFSEVLPHGSLFDWSREVKESPVPVSTTLEKISTLFLIPSFDKILEKGTPPYPELDGLAMNRFFENKLSIYCELVLGRDDCKVIETGCGFDDICAQGTNCHDTHKSDPSHYCLRETDYGGVVIVGGNTGADYYTGATSDTETVNFYDLADLPSRIQGNTLTAVGATLYSCGGRVYLNSISYTDQRTCYYLDTTSSLPSWDTFVLLPSGVSHHTAVSVGQNIWIVVSNKLYSVNIAQRTVSSFSTPFTVFEGHCSVSSGTQSYVIGVGSSNNEIWVNNNPSTPSSWYKRVTTLPTALSNHACLWFGSDVIITGGTNHLDTAYVFSTTTNEIRSTRPMNEGRHGHQMMVLDGKPAVVAGWRDTRALSSIETYDMIENVWKENSKQINQPREYFGLAQLNLIVD